ncbi:MAG: hypothetical protein R3E56_15180 [Burkholderiaceae bacterium]
MVTTIAGSFAGQGYVSGQARRLDSNDIEGIAKDSAGNIYVSDTDNQAVQLPPRESSPLCGAALRQALGGRALLMALGLQPVSSIAQIGIDAVTTYMLQTSTTTVFGRLRFGW